VAPDVVRDPNLCAGAVDQARLPRRLSDIVKRGSIRAVDHAAC
jgi:hypothetical protein